MRMLLVFTFNLIALIIIPLVSSFLADRRNPFWKRYDLFGNFFVSTFLTTIYILPRVLFLFVSFLIRAQLKREFGFSETFSSFFMFSFDALMWYGIEKSKKFSNTPLLWKIIWVHLFETIFLFLTHFIIAAISQKAYFTIVFPWGWEIEL